MKILTNKAMTLFELLAVIVIIGIIAAIAFPTVNRVVENSRKDAFAANVNNFLDAAVSYAVEDNMDTSNTVYVFTFADGVLSLKAGKTDDPVDEVANFTKETLGFTKDLGIESGVVKVEITTTGTSNTATVKITTDLVGDAYKVDKDAEVPIKRVDVKDNE